MVSGNLSDGLMRSIWSLGDSLSKVFLPDLCLICESDIEQGGRYVCSSCWTKLPVFPDRSAQPLRPLRGVLTKLWIGWNYDDSMKRIIHFFKYHHRPEMGDLLIREYLRTIPDIDDLVATDLFLPVPIHAARRRWRGFNQSELLAKSLGDRLQIKVDSSHAVRVVNTPSQTRLSRGQRWGNLAEAFEVQTPAIFAGRRITIVDDLVTSGATIHALAQQLLQAGAREVGASVITSPDYGDS
jgi:ComF family protein